MMQIQTLLVFYDEFRHYIFEHIFFRDTGQSLTGQWTVKQQWRVDARQLNKTFGELPNICTALFNQYKKIRSITIIKSQDTTTVGEIQMTDYAERITRMAN